MVGQGPELCPLIKPGKMWEFQMSWSFLNLETGGRGKVCVLVF
jgi:hypothetical protein